jgi:ribosomal-protein-alanine N-acetyltransferase
MTMRDLDAVVAIEVGAYGFPWSRGNFVDSLAAGHAAEVLEWNDALVGYYIAMPGVDEMHLLNIAVAPRWQGQGLGSLLLDAVRAAAEQRGLHALWLEVRESNVRARALYARRGFETVARRRDYYPAATGREDAVVMSLILFPQVPRGVD